MNGKPHSRAEVVAGQTRNDVILATLASRSPLSFDEIHQALDEAGFQLNIEQVKSNVYGLSSQGRLVSLGGGRWTLADNSAPTPTATPTPLPDHLGDLLEVVGFDSQGNLVARTVDNGHTIYRLEAV